MDNLPTLAELISGVERREPLGDPLARLARATEVREGLDALSDALLDHFVESARSKGSSWSDIGGALGVSKQAAQQRHTSEQTNARRLRALRKDRGKAIGAGLFGGRFSSEAHETVVSAQVEARELGHVSIGSEHLLLGLLAVGGLAADALASCGVDHANVQSKVIDVHGTATELAPRRIPFTARAKKILELALRESLDLKSKVIGPEHLLLGIAREGESTAMQVLLMLGTDASALRHAVLDRLHPSSGK